MYLRSLEIKNFRSLEHVLIDKLDMVNVFIGRNNVGKSSIFQTLLFLANIMHGKSVLYDSIVTAKDPKRSIEIALRFEPREKDRTDFVDILGGNLSKDRHKEIMESPFFRQVEYFFKSAVGLPYLMHLRQIRLMAEDNQWAIVQILTGNDKIGNPEARNVNLKVTADQNTKLNHQIMHVQSSKNIEVFNLFQNYPIQTPANINSASWWLLIRLSNFLKQTFFFSPFRHSESRMPVKQVQELDQSGANLAQLLHTINSNDREKFETIERFVHLALHDMGKLHTPLFDTQTEVSYKPPGEEYSVRLHDMGGGIEQLLMIATVLTTTGEEHTLFLEEPESHLHPGAQRFLIEKLSVSNRQIFITSHSPIFINSAQSKNIYQVKMSNTRSIVNHIKNSKFLSEVLEEIGSRNSDVLLSEAVLFVEGPSDQKAIDAWSNALGLSLEENNITILPMGGAENASRGTHLRSDLLKGVSQKSPVPHLFIIDRDQRNQKEIQKIKELLGNKVFILEKRELENYFLDSRILLASIRAKYVDNGEIKRKIDLTNFKTISQLMKTAADDLYELVLIKRLRTELGGLREGLLSKNSIENLKGKTNDINFYKLVLQEIETRFSDHIKEVDIGQVTNEIKKTLDKEWADPANRLSIAPGEEIVNKVYEYFGGKYNKVKDAEQIAREMKTEEIPGEIKIIIQTAIDMSNRPLE